MVSVSDVRVVEHINVDIRLADELSAAAACSPLTNKHSHVECHNPLRKPAYKTSAPQSKEKGRKSTMVVVHHIVINRRMYSTLRVVGSDA